MFPTKRTRTSDNRRAFDYIPKFPSISGPFIRLEDIQYLGIYTCHKSSMLLVQGLNHNLSEERYVFHPCTKGREEDLKNAQSIEDVVPQVGLSRLAGCGQQPHIDGQLVTATQAAHAQRFKNA